jgi:hypothetical protein
MTTNIAAKPVLQRVTIHIDIPFFSLELSVDPSVNQGDNAAMPTTVKFSPEQTNSESYEGQEIEFYGPLEFSAFRRAIKALDATLTRQFGENGEWDVTVTVREEYGYAQ